MSSSSHWLAIQYSDDGTVIDVAPFGGERTASRFCLAAGRAKAGWTVRHVPEGKTSLGVFAEDLPEVGPRKVPAKKAAATKAQRATS